jgi:hypothetical protein
MQPFTVRFIIAAWLFALITIASIRWWVRQIPENPEIPAARASIEVRPAKDSFDPTIYSVAFCELVKNPVRYDRKLIKMQAVFVNGVDWAYIASDACPDENGTVEAAGALEPNDKLLESTSRDQIGPLLDRLMREGRPLEFSGDMLGRFYAGGPDGRGHRFAIVTASGVRPTGRSERR